MKRPPKSHGRKLQAALMTACREEQSEAAVTRDYWDNITEIISNHHLKSNSVKAVVSDKVKKIQTLIARRNIERQHAPHRITEAD